MITTSNLIINSNINLLEIIKVLETNRYVKNLDLNLSNGVRIVFDYKAENRIIRFFNFNKSKEINFCGENEIKDLKDGEWFTNLDINNCGNSKEIMLFIAEHLKAKNNVWFQENDTKDKFELIK